MTEESRHATDAFWLAQIDGVTKRLDRLDRRLESLAEDVHNYITNHDEWCAGLSKVLSGAVAVMSTFERYGGTEIPVAAGVRTAEGVWVEEEPDEDGP